MNTRLKELFKQASTTPWHPDDQGSFDAEKFAELIIRECAQVVNDNNFKGSTLGDRLLFEHFGVKIDRSAEIMSEAGKELITYDGDNNG